MKLLLWLYPRRWRDRYGDEFLALLEEQRLRPLDVVNVVVSALRLRFGGQASRPEAHLGKRRARFTAVRVGLILVPLLTVLFVIGYLTTRHTSPRFASPATPTAVQSVTRPGQLVIDRPGQFKAPQGIAVDTAGRIYVDDTDNHRILVLSPMGQVLMVNGHPCRVLGTPGVRIAPRESTQVVPVEPHVRPAITCAS